MSPRGGNGAVDEIARRLTECGPVSSRACAWSCLRAIVVPNVYACCQLVCLQYPSICTHGHSRRPGFGVAGKIPDFCPSLRMMTDQYIALAFLP